MAPTEHLQAVAKYVRVADGLRFRGFVFEMTQVMEKAGRPHCVELGTNIGNLLLELCA